MDIGAARLSAEVVADTSALSSGLNQASQQVKGWADEVTRSTSSLGSTISGALAAGFGAGAALAGINGLMGAMNAAKGAAIDFNSQLQRSEIAFTQFTGSTERAQTFLQQLKETAATTPFEFKDLLTGAQRFAGLGMQIEQVIPLMKDIGVVAESMGAGAEQINSITLALAQMSARGKVNAGDMNQLANAGIAAWTLLSKSMDLPISKLQEMAEKGQISSQELLNAFHKAAQDPAMQQMAEKMNQSWDTATSNIKDRLTDLVSTGFRPVFDGMTAMANAVANGLDTQAVHQFTADVATTMADAGTALQTFAGQWSGIGEAIGRGDLGQAVQRSMAEVGTIVASTGNDLAVGGYNMAASLASGFLQGADDLITAAAQQVADIIASFLVGESPPQVGPLSKIDQGGYNVAAAWVDGFSAGPWTGVTNVAAFISDQMKNVAEGFDTTAIGAALFEQATRGAAGAMIDLAGQAQQAVQYAEGWVAAQTGGADAIRAQFDALKQANDLASTRLDLEGRIKNLYLDQALSQAQGDPVQKAQLQNQLDAVAAEKDRIRNQETINKAAAGAGAQYKTDLGTQQRMLDLDAQEARIRQQMADMVNRQAVAQTNVQKATYASATAAQRFQNQLGGLQGDLAATYLPPELSQAAAAHSAAAKAAGSHAAAAHKAATVKKPKVGKPEPPHVDSIIPRQSLEDAASKVGERMGVNLGSRLGEALGKVGPQITAALAGAITGARIAGLPGAIVGAIFGPRLLDELNKRVPDLQQRVQAAFNTIFSTLQINFGPAFAQLSQGNISGALASFGAGLGNVGGMLAAQLGAQLARVDWAGVWRQAQFTGTALLSGLGNIAGGIASWLGSQMARVDWGGVWRQVQFTGSALLNGLGDIAGGIGAWLGQQFSRINWPQVWSTAGDIIGGLFSALGTIANRFAGWLGDQLTAVDWAGVWKSTGDIAGGIAGGIFAAAGDIAGRFTAWLGEQVGKIDWNGVWSNLKQVGADVANLLPQPVHDALDWLGTTAFPAIVTAGQQFSGWLQQSAIPALQDLATGLGPPIHDALDWLITTGWPTALSTAQDFGTWLQGTGLPALRDLSTTLDTNVKPALDWMGTTGLPGLQTAAQNVNGPLQGFLQFLQNLDTELANRSVYSDLKTIWDDLYATGNNLVTTVGNLVKPLQDATQPARDLGTAITDANPGLKDMNAYAGPLAALIGGMLLPFKGLADLLKIVSDNLAELSKQKPEMILAGFMPPGLQGAVDSWSKLSDIFGTLKGILSSFPAVPNIPVPNLGGAQTTVKTGATPGGYQSQGSTGGGDRMISPAEAAAQLGAPSAAMGKPGAKGRYLYQRPDGSFYQVLDPAEAGPGDKQVGSGPYQATKGGPMDQGPSSVSGAGTRAAKYSAEIAAASAQTGVPPDVIAAIIDTENSGEGSTSSANAKGLMQVVPGQGYDRPGENPFDPGTSIMQGARALADKKRIAQGIYGPDASWVDAAGLYFGQGRDAGGTTTGGYRGMFEQNRGKYGQGGGGETRVTGSPGFQPIDLSKSQIDVARAEGLDTATAKTMCGPYAAMLFQNSVGRNPTAREATDLARQFGWVPGQGMTDATKFSAYAQAAVGDSAKVVTDVTPTAAEAAQANQTGSPVAFNTPEHYFVSQGYDPTSGKFNVGATGTVLGGSEFMSFEEMSKLGGGITQTISLIKTAADGATPSVQGLGAAGQQVGAALGGASQALTPMQQAIQGVIPVSQQAQAVLVGIGNTDWSSRLTEQANNFANLMNTSVPVATGNAAASFAAMEGAIMPVENAVAQGNLSMADLDSTLVQMAANSGLSITPLSLLNAQLTNGVPVAQASGIAFQSLLDDLAPLDPQFMSLKDAVANGSMSLDQASLAVLNAMNAMSGLPSATAAVATGIVKPAQDVGTAVGGMATAAQQSSDVVLQQILAAVQGVQASLQQMVADLQGAATAIGTTISTAMTTANAEMVAAWNTSLADTKSTWTEIGATLTAALNSAVDKITAALDASNKQISSGWDAANKATSDQWGVINKTVDDSTGAVTKTIGDGGKDWVGAINDQKSPATSAAKDLGESIVDGMVSGVKGKQGNLAKAVEDMVKSALAAGQKAAGSHSPSKVAYLHGTYITRGYVEAIMDGHRDVARAAGSLAEAGLEPLRAGEHARARISASESRRRDRAGHGGGDLIVDGYVFGSWAERERLARRATALRVGRAA